MYERTQSATEYIAIVITATHIEHKPVSNEIVVCCCAKVAAECKKKKNKNKNSQFLNVCKMRNDLFDMCNSIVIDKGVEEGKYIVVNFRKVRPSVQISSGNVKM